MNPNTVKKSVSYVQLLAQMIFGLFLSLVLMAIFWQATGCAFVFGLMAIGFGIGAYFAGRRLMNDIRGLRPKQPGYFTAVDTAETPHVRQLPSAPSTPAAPAQPTDDDTNSIFL